MNNYDYYLNNYNRSYSLNDYNLLPTLGTAPNTSIQTTNVQLYNPTEGFDKANLFSNLYDPYKNFRPTTLTAKTEQEKIYLDLSRNAFAAHELNLYLDVYPNNNSIIALFNDYREKANTLKEEYEKKYGALSISSDTLRGKTPFAWVEDKWPWEGGMF